jgi:DNA mismatch repair protein MutL
MPRIKCLSEEVSRQIAAGEVVERPASVVKELVENALDAEASSITVEIEKGGIGRITIEDDGCGMSREDLSLATRNFSTSKIESAADLTGITTYGFRGEALASISAVSLMSIRTNDTDGAEGWELDLSGDGGLSPRPAARMRGTTVTVRNLFYNTPARRKFLASELSEKRKILETVLGFALIHHDIEFHLIDSGKHLLDLIPAEHWRERVAAVLGSSSMKHMVPIESAAGPATLQGFASLPTFTRSNRNHQYFYVNGRLVKEKTLMHAALEAYRGVIPPRRFPVLVIALNIPPQEVDVNVHPSKLEVRLRNSRDVHALCTRALRTALSGEGEKSLPVSRVPGGPSPQAGVGMKHGEAGGELFEGSVLKEERSDDDKVIPLKSRIERAYSLFMQREGAARDISEQLSLRSRDEPEGMAKKLPGPEKHVLDEGLFWQFNKSFIFIQVHGGLVIIDQHAAHERIIFDTSRKSLEKSISVSQQILFPIHLELSLSELEVFHSSREIFERLGFVIEPFGGKSILVRGYPQGLKNWEEGRLLIQILDDIVQDRVPGEDHAHKILASFACRSAVKAGHKLKVHEMQVLADQLFAVENPYSCPHGRPTIQRISLDEIEKWFLR